MVLEVLMVPKAGLEPARISTVDFESTASTDFATSALKGYGNVVDYTCRWPPCKQQRVSAALSVEKNSARPAQDRLTSHFPSLLPGKFPPYSTAPSPSPSPSLARLPASFCQASPRPMLYTFCLSTPNQGNRDEHN